MEAEDTQMVLQKLQKANQLMEDLIDLALSDEKITEEEQEMLFSINENLQEFVKLTISSVSDNVVTKEERTKLKSVQNKIIAEAEKVATSDQIISADEKQILDSLILSIRELAD